jgi:para-aminobenzoate synthetase
VGYLGYASRPDLPARPAADVPDAVWMRVRDPLVIEHEVAAEPARGADPGAAAAPDRYRDAFAAVQEELHAGNSYEVNLTYRERFTSTVDPVAAYLRLRSANPAPYAGFLRHGDVALLSSSPERYAVVDRQRRLETKPIKGTTPRGPTHEADVKQAARLATDPKFRAENLMIVDLLRNDLSMVCEPGTVEVPVLMDVESYPSVHQLVSTVRGHLRDDVATVDALRALFPAGSMTGAPKRRTMEIIDRVEDSPRGVYAGAFGWISGDGRADLGVVIRSLVARRAGPSSASATAATSTGTETWEYTWGTGGGITVRSDLEEEWAETRWKAARLRAALTED